MTKVKSHSNQTPIIKAKPAKKPKSRMLSIQKNYLIKAVDPSRKAGRHVFTPDLIQAFNEYFLAGMTIKMACEKAGISEQTYRRFCTNHPQLAAQWTSLRKDTAYQAIQTVRRAITGYDKLDENGDVIGHVAPDPKVAMWYLTKREKAFADKIIQEKRNTSTTDKMNAALHQLMLQDPEKGKQVLASLDMLRQYIPQAEETSDDGDQD